MVENGNGAARSFADVACSPERAIGLISPEVEGEEHS